MPSWLVQPHKSEGVVRVQRNDQLMLDGVVAHGRCAWDARSDDLRLLAGADTGHAAVPHATDILRPVGGHDHAIIPTFHGALRPYHRPGWVVGEDGVVTDVHHCGVVHNSKLEGENYGRIISSGFLFCTCRSSCTCKNGKINKNLERKRNPGSGLQGRVIHCSEQLSHSGVVYSSYSVLHPSLS